MPTARQPGHVYRTPARRPPPPSGVDTMKVAGILFCISAVISAVASVALREPGDPMSTRTSALGGAFFVLLLGLALIQGVGGVRVFVLIAAAVGSLAAIAGAALLHSIRELQVLALAVLVTAVGYFSLLLSKEASKARVAVSVSLIVLGAGATLAAQVWLAGYAKRAFGERLRQVATDRREYSDPAAGVSIAVPAGWVILREDADMYRGVPSRVTLADPDAGTVAFLNYDRRAPGLLSLDHYLDVVLGRLNESGLEARQSERTDVIVGKAPARRMSLTWKEGGQRVNGFISAWLDGDSIFMLVGASVDPWSSAADERFAALERALQFTAPVETALSDAQTRLTADCPIFTAASVRTIGRKIPPGSATEAYFKVGWSWAVRGQGQLDAAAIAELGRLMREVFSSMPPAERQSFGSYTEKVRARRGTTRDEDVAAMHALGRAAGRLPPGSLERLQSLTEAALTVGALM